MLKQGEICFVSLSLKNAGTWWYNMSRNPPAGDTAGPGIGPHTSIQHLRQRGSVPKQWGTATPHIASAYEELPLGPS